MRKIVIICLCVLAFQLDAFSLHILGGEITYKHESDLQYKVFVTIYRDCSECKLAGEGGGPSAKDCGKFELYLKTSDRGECKDSLLAKPTLTRSSIREILPFCSSTKSLCESNTGESYGIEAHTFYATVDFEAYKRFSSCGFELYVKMASRSNDIDNITGGEQHFYNFAFIDPFVAHSSGQFNKNPQIILPLNQPVRTMVLGENEEADSMEVQFGRPLRDANRDISYAVGFSPERPLSVYCNGSDACKPHPYANTPIGMYLHRKKGNLIFTPINNNEKATVVFEIRKWARTEKGMTLISVVRRDIQLEVSSISTKNNPPVLNGTSLDGSMNLNVCEGEELCFDIVAEDIPYRFPDGTYQNQNTVTYNWETNIPGASIKQTGISSPPYNKISFCWTPKKADAGKTFEIYVRAEDDNCPLVASHETLYTVTVNKRVEPKFEVTKLWCGNARVEFIPANGEKLKSLAWGVTNSQGGQCLKSAGVLDTINFDKGDAYTIFAIADYDNGCSFEFDQELVINENELYQDFGVVVGNRNWCIGDTGRLSVSSVNDVLLTSHVWMKDQDTLSKSNTFSYHRSQKGETKEEFLVLFTGIQKGLTCRDSQLVEVDITSGPEVVFNEGYGFCNTELSDELSNLVDNKNGVWRPLGHNALKDNRLDPSGIPNKTVPHEFCLEYTSYDIRSSCKSVDTFCIWANPLPELKMGITTVCGSSGYFNLKNMAKNLYPWGDYNIRWELDGEEVLPLYSNDPNLIKLKDLSIGSHKVVGILTNEFGCSMTDSAILNKLEDVDLSDITDKKMCQGELVNLSELFEIKANGGIWSCSDQPGVVQDNQLIADACGNLVLNYTYDRYGCYASSDFELDVVCKPEVEFSFDDTICAAHDSYELSATPVGGNFVGERIVNNTLEVANQDGLHEFTYTLESRGCSFSKDGSIWVAPSPTYGVNPEFRNAICEGELIEIDRLEVSNGLLTISTPGIEIPVKDNLFNFEYTPTKGEIAKGAVDFSFVLNGMGNCPEQKEVVTIPVHPLGRLNLPLKEFNGCQSYVFEPQVLANENVNWNTTDIEWSIGPGLQTSGAISPRYVFHNPGTYSVSVYTRTAEGCTYEQDWDNIIDVYHSPVADFVTTPDGYISIKDPMVVFKDLSYSEKDVMYHWNFGTGHPEDTSNLKSPSFSFDQDTGHYEVKLKVYTDKGCSDVATTQLWIGPDIQIFVPNAFSPNGKGSEITERFKVVGNNVDVYHIEIFNRWGNQVYTSNDIGAEWDGRARTEVCPVGVYAYLIRATSLTGQEYEFKGTLNLLR
ncbi:MAG: gliding motility-associated C-terminal domain-containing protein [Bacteroidia bacterium]|nr:gliding motility-associated C-terminal domain-containing protein [Bacteroidia bacterium]